MVSAKLAAVANKFPDPAELERRYRILTVIEAITDNGGYRHYYYYAQKDRKSSCRVAFYDSGSGDHARIIFADHLTFISAFDHESYVNPWVTGKIWPGILQDLPFNCRQFVKLDPFEITSVLWHLGAGWKHGSPAPLDDGQELEPTFWMFDAVIEHFSAHGLAKDFSDHTDSCIRAESLSPLLDESPLTEKIIQFINPDANTVYVKYIAETAGYPSHL